MPPIIRSLPPLSNKEPVTRSLRSDAARNRARLLDAAEGAFAKDGTDASLEDIARRAGVGIGTLYRNFPTREDLVAALIHQGVDELVAQSNELLGADDPFDALQIWLHALVRHAAAYRGLAESLVTAAGSDSPLSEACHQQEAAAAALFDRAQQRGRLRPDASLGDLLDLVSSIAWVVQRRATANGDRLLTIALDGLRAPAG